MNGRQLILRESMKTGSSPGKLPTKPNANSTAIRLSKAEALHRWALSSIVHITTAVCVLFNPARTDFHHRAMTVLSQPTGDVRQHNADIRVKCLIPFEATVAAIAAVAALEPNTGDAPAGMKTVTCKSPAKAKWKGGISPIRSSVTPSARIPSRVERQTTACVEP